MSGIDPAKKRVAGFYWCQRLDGYWIVAQWGRTGAHWRWLTPGVPTSFRSKDHFIAIDERKLFQDTTEDDWQKNLTKTRDSPGAGGMTAPATRGYAADGG